MHLYKKACIFPIHPVIARVITEHTYLKYVCVCVCVCVCVFVLCHLSCLTPCDPMDCSPPNSCLWDSSGKNTGMGCHALFQGIFWTQ